MQKKIKAIVVGAGHRGIGYANYALLHSSELKIVGVVDPDKSRCEKIRLLHNIPPENIFDSVEDLVAGPKLADVIINGTMDNLHIQTTLPLLDAGYDILLEKPICSSKSELLSLLEKSRETGRKVMICHVLRYAPFYVEIRKRIASGVLGEILNIQTAEHVSYHHMSVAFIRGKWGRKDQCGSSILLAKCCHDIDLIVWLKTGNAPHKVCSFGSLQYFKSEKAPEGAGTQCLVDCKIESSCLYSAKKLYLDHPERWDMYVWNTIDRKDNPSQKEMVRSLRSNNPQGRCIWKSDNNVVDHQSVIVEFADGSTATHNLAGGTAKPGRYIHITGTKGEIRGCMEDGSFTMYTPDSRPGRETQEEIIDLNVSGDMHGGGDYKLVEDFINVINGAEHSISTTSIEDSVYGHLVVYAADKSMEENSIVEIVNL